MKHQLDSLFNQAISQLKDEGVIPPDHPISVKFERTRQKEHGDFATNLALTMAKAAGRSPRELAQLIVDRLPADGSVTQVEIAGPGFINVFLTKDTRQAVVSEVLAQAESYGCATPNSGRKIMVEFVSANPTGPLHVGHGRGAAYGDALARLLTAAGHSVAREYYVNDAGRQMDILATSLWLRYLQSAGVAVELPENAYQGSYLVTMASELLEQHGDTHVTSLERVLSLPETTDSEAALDALIEFAKTSLGTAGYSLFFNRVLERILADIRDDLHAFRVDFDRWFSEKSLFDSGKITAAVEQLKSNQTVYEKGGAWWFKSTEFGDEKDRVVVRENGQPTYFASDIAYHKDKLDRGFDECINIWGADHHGYIARVKAALSALQLDPDKLKIVLVQFAVLWRGGEKVKMSTRSGEFVTLRELRDEVGVDAARFFYAQRKSEQHMDFDLDLAKSESNENPVYYVQYAHARICSVFRQAKERQLRIGDLSAAPVSKLDSEHELALLTLLERFPETIQHAAANYEPHQVSYFLRDVATAFHAWYNTTKFLEAEPDKRDAILALCEAVRLVLANGLQILGVKAAEKM